VADTLRDAGFGTLLLDLLTAREEARDRLTAEYRFDIDLLAGRLRAAVRWLRGRAGSARLDVGFFGASTGAAAALVAAAAMPDDIAAIVSRGGRPDLAGTALRAVRAPTLLIVGGDDQEVLALNARAAAELRAVHELAVVPRATHLFEERGALEAVALLAADWFGRYLTTSP
jgi:dienelactone hydrolase